MRDDPWPRRIFVLLLVTIIVVVAAVAIARVHNQIDQQREDFKDCLNYGVYNAGSIEAC